MRVVVVVVVVVAVVVVVVVVGFCVAGRGLGARKIEAAFAWQARDLVNR